VPDNSEKFANLAAQMHWQMRLDLQRGLIALPDDEELYADLIARKWSLRNSVITMDDKTRVKAMLGRSPDKGDAAVMWNWIRQYDPTAAFSGKYAVAGVSA
jgi:hypothetical protein